MISIHNVPYALQRIRHVFKQQIWRPSGFSQSGNLKEESSPWVQESASFSGIAERLAGKSAANEVNRRKSIGVNGSCIWIVDLLLSGGVDGSVAGVGSLIYFTVADTLKASGAGQPRPETADPGEHIQIANQVIDHLLF